MNKKESITFPLPPFQYSPVGGFKIVYEYANMLVCDGYDVHIVYGDKTKYDGKNVSRWILFKLYIKHWLFHMGLIKRSARIWYPLSEDINEHNVYSLDQKYIPETDIYICTGVDTACYLEKYKAVDQRKKFYFIQDYEVWGRKYEDVRETYHYDMTKIVISQWLKRIVMEENEKCYVVPNGFDSKEYYLTYPIDKRKPTEISMLYHASWRKGCKISFDALNMVKRSYPELHVSLFGTPESPEGLPDWYTYYQCPSKEQHLWLNNHAAIYVAASETEGWGLTIGEAMMCGQAVCCTDIDGFKEMVTDNESALLSPVGDAETLAANIIRLIKDENLRIQIAANGISQIKKFSRENSYRLFKCALNLK